MWGSSSPTWPAAWWGKTAAPCWWLRLWVGAALLTGCDLLSRLLFAPYELPVGIVLSLGGGPFFLWLLLKQRGGRTP